MDTLWTEREKAGVEELYDLEANLVPPSRDASGESGVSPRDTTEERCDLLRWLGLEEVAGGARLHGLQHFVLLVEDGEDEDLHLGPPRLDRAAVHWKAVGQGGSVGANPRRSYT